MQPAYVETSPWKDKTYINELYLSTDVTELHPVTQVQAVCFTSDKQIMLYKHIDGWFGLPGGKVEEGEDLKQALAREIDEEVAAELIDCGVFAYNKSWEQQSPGRVTYNLRYWALVKPVDKALNDPAGKAIERLLVSQAEAIEKLGWGEKGRILIENALKYLS